MTVTKSPHAVARTATVRPGRPLSGVVRVEGSKTATLILLAAAAATRRPVKLENVPAGVDTSTMLTLIKSCGYHIARPVTEPKAVVILPTAGRASTPDPALVAQFRASYYLIPALLASRGQATLPWSAGTGIADPLMRLHFTVYEAFGDTVVRNESGYRVQATDVNHKEVHVRLPSRSRSATVAAIARAVLSKTSLRLNNPNLSPEVISLLDCLGGCGWSVELTNQMLAVSPPSRGHDTALPWTVPGDKATAGALACAVAATRGSARIEGIHGRDIAPVMDALRQLGIPTNDGVDAVTVRADQARPTHRPLWAAASLEPDGLDTDCGPALIAVALGMPGTHTFADPISPGRHTDLLRQLRHFGARFDEISTAQCRLTGPQRLTGSTVRATDFGTGSALIIAALTAHGTTTIEELDRLQRDHAELSAALRHLGANITEGTR